MQRRKTKKAQGEEAASIAELDSIQLLGIFLHTAGDEVEDRQVLLAGDRAAALLSLTRGESALETRKAKSTAPLSKAEQAKKCQVTDSHRE